MARVAALVPDLLFGSRLQGALTAAGHEVTLVSTPEALEQLLEQEPPAPVLVVDLTDVALDGAAALHSLQERGLLGRTRTLAFYSHVDVAARERAERAGFDLIVPRSRLAREAPELVTRLAVPAGG